MKISLFLAICIFAQFGFSGKIISESKKNNREISTAKAVLHSGLIGCKEIDGVAYMFYGFVPGIVDIVYWPGGSTGVGNYGTSYTTPLLGISNLNFTGPNGLVQYSGPIYACGD